MLQVKAVLVGRKPKQLEVPESLTVGELRKSLEEAFKLPKLCIVFKGKSLTTDDQSVKFSDGDTMLVTVPQSSPSISNDDPDQDAEADITFHLDPSASAVKKWIYSFLADTLRLPNIVLYWIFSIRPVYYLSFMVWMILSPIAAKYDLGPVYILGTIFLLIVVNLGVRREGELSGYSLFNENVQSLPGQLQADQIDQQIRHGRM